MQTDAQKLDAVEASLRRWHKRLTRATNAIRKLETKRRRLSNPVRTLADRPREHTKVRLSSGEVVGVKADSEIPLPELDAFFIPVPKLERPRAQARIAHLAEDLGPALREAAEDAGMIPACLDRKNPVVVEQITAARKQREAEERKKMPLTGAAALKKIKSKK